MNVEEIIKTDKILPLEQRTILHMLLIHNRISEVTHAALKPFEVSPEQFNVLRILKGQGTEPANLSTLNERMVSKTSNTSRLVDKLLAKGYVDRRTCKTNRRKIEIRITPKGNSVLQEMNREIDKAERQLLENFSETQMRELNKLLDLF